MEFDLESVAMELVGNAGESKSLAFEALEFAKQGEFTKAEEKMKEAEEKILETHRLQTNLIFMEADGQKVEINILMVHAQDHLMTAIMAKDLIKEFISMYKKLYN
ncbi:MAG: cellobiose system component [Fusobacteriaceae bacterium]|jgi:PTS system cellobiose-specific IIA component|nr:cellobiose system component [Fusobacteriaceae bacterium]